MRVETTTPPRLVPRALLALFLVASIPASAREARAEVSLEAEETEQASARDAQTETDLDEKAEYFRRRLVERHLSPEGVVLYRLYTSTRERDLATGLYPELADAPTFTGIFAATSCLRARVAPTDERAEALQDAARALAGLESLTAVTGTPGLFARTLRASPEPEGERRGRWFAGGLGYEQYRWRGDVSFDQYANGVLPAIWECRDLFRKRTRALAVAIAGVLRENDMQLIDPDGRRTRYGDLSPRSGFGTNSIAQLTGYAAFSLAALLDPEGDWSEDRDRLRDRYRVPASTRITNLRVGALTNFSNDMMAWNLYRVLLPLTLESRDPARLDLRHGMYRAWLRVRNDRNAYFALLFCQLEPDACEVAEVAAARELLEHFPTDKTPKAPAPELDALPRRWLPGRKWTRQAEQPVPIELRRTSSFEWKSSPYRLDGRPSDASSDIEYTGLDYLAAYWLLVSYDTSRERSER